MWKVNLFDTHLKNVAVTDLTISITNNFPENLYTQLLDFDSG